MKKCIYTLLIIGLTGISQLGFAQIFSIGASGVTVKSGTSLFGGGMLLTPSVNFTMSNVMLSKTSTISNGPSQPYIARVYQFSNNTLPFTGTVQINYQPGELNGISENNLMLNVQDGTNWKPINGTVNNTSHYVLSNTFSSVSLNKLALASCSAPLPLSWLSFTAIKQKANVALVWSTVNEKNTKNFTVQFSRNGMQWNEVIMIPAGSPNSNTRNYHYLHTAPVNGINYYRILQSDFDGRSSYSVLRTVKFTGNAEAFYVLGNPVKNGMLQVQVNSAVLLELYTLDGKKIWQQQTPEGMKQINVGHFAAGLYFLKGDDQNIKIVLQ